MSKNKTKIGGGYENYSLRSATEVVNYFPGPMRVNLLLDPTLAIGKYDPGTFGNDQWYNGPGTLLQALPDASKYQTNRIFAKPRGNPYRNFGVDSRQIAAYQVEQLQNNPLSQYTNNPNGVIPGFECMAEPDSYSTMENKRENDYKSFFEDGGSIFEQKGMPSGIDVYEQFHGPKINPNAEVVYNMNLNSSEIVNPMIALGSSSSIRNNVDFSGKCYSGNFIPGKQISNNGGNNPPEVYEQNRYRPRTEMDKGMINSNTQTICMSDRALNFANPLILQ